MTILVLLHSVAGGSYLPAAVIAIAWARKLVSPDSRVPINIPPRALPLVTAALGAAYATVVAVQQGAPWRTALGGAAITAIAAGALDGLLVALFGAPENAPGWARALVLLADKVAETERETLPPPTPKSASEAVTRPDAPISLRGADLLVVLGAGAAIAGAALCLAACTPADRQAAAADALRGLDMACAARAAERDVVREPPLSTASSDAGTDAR